MVQTFRPILKFQIKNKKFDWQMMKMPTHLVHQRINCSVAKIVLIIALFTPKWFLTTLVRWIIIFIRFFVAPRKNPTMTPVEIIIKPQNSWNINNCSYYLNQVKRFPNGENLYNWKLPWTAKINGNN